MLSTLQRAKRNGATIVAVNPLAETGLRRFKHPQEVMGLLGRGTEIADFLLRVRVGGDVALFQGIGKALLEREGPGTLDSQFIAEHTDGFDAYVANLRATSWDAIHAACGVPHEDIVRAADVFARSERTITCWGMGLTQHVNAVANIQEIVNLHLLRGQIGKPGAGLCPVRGHSNVQGDRTVGIWEQPRPEFLDRLGAVFGFTPPRHHGLDTVGAIRAMHAGQAKVFFALGGNFLQATPDTEYVATALRRCRLTVHVSIKPNRAHLVTGERALILPCLGRSEHDVQPNGEQFVSTENSMGIVQASRGVLPPASPELAERAGDRGAPRPRDVRRPRHRRLGGARRRLRSRPRRDRACDPRLRAVQRARARARGLPSTERRARARVPHGNREGALHRAPAPDTARWPRASWC